MKAKAEFRDRPDTEVAILDALADRPEEGLTVLELRSHVDVDIDSLEDALANLKEDDLIEVTNETERTVILPEERVVGPDETDDEASLFDAIKRRFGR
ncbi:DUF6432 family protein [Halomicrobium urmianum]|uniref:DUF6432 family protein n=1 Tax=Halomicrobium urmianum TaxID=1586233 RepID=UPI001CD9C6AD|nr:DUF6432 family protein [Halomicrobium urmianum]